MATPSLGQSESSQVTGSKSDALPDEPNERLTSTSLTPTSMGNNVSNAARTQPRRRQRTRPEHPWRGCEQGRARLS
jgi:hypothetical protein